MFVPLGGLSFLMALFVKDVGLPDDKPKEVGAASPISTTSEENPSSSRSNSEVPHEIPIGEKQNIDSEEKVTDGENKT
jgi:hypothetical protein